jgi:hypothetical protein
MKKETKTKKPVQKKVKNELVVDFTNINSIDDAIAAIAEAKVRAGQAINNYELGSIVKSAIDNTLDDLFSWNNAVIQTDDYSLLKLNMSLYKTVPNIRPIITKKEGFFKRLWKKITRK